MKKLIKKIMRNSSKSLFVTLFLFTFIGVISCSNDNLTDVTFTNKGGIIDTPIVVVEECLDGLGAVEITYDGSAYGAVNYKITASSADKTIPDVEVQVSGNSVVFPELLVAKYKFTIVGYGQIGNIVCGGSISANVKDDVDLRISASLIEANDSTIFETKYEDTNSFMYEKVDTLCVGDTNHVQVDAGDNWFGFIATEHQVLFLSWVSDVSIQLVKVYKDGRDESNDLIYDSTENSHISDIANQNCEIQTAEDNKEHCYYVRVVATQESSNFAISLSDNSLPVTTTTTVYVPVTTTSTTVTGGTITSSTSSTIVVPTEKTPTPSIAYNNSGFVTISCTANGSNIYYTMNGKVPTEKSTKYSVPFSVEAGTTIRAIATHDGYLTSDVATFTVQCTVNIHIDYEEEQEEFNGIRVLVAKSLKYDKIHYWNCSNNTMYPATSWPGIALSSYDNNDYYYDFQGCNSVQLLITNANGGKLCADDMKITDKGVYRVTNSGAKLETDVVTTTTVSTTTTTVAPSGNIVVHWPTNLGYSHIYAWGTGTTPYTGAWPGTVAKDGDNDGYYDYTISGKSQSNVIFNNGVGGSAGNGQTADLSISASGEYWYVGNKTGTGSSSDWTTTNPNGPSVPTYTMSSSAYLGKTFTITVNSSTNLTESTITITNNGVGTKKTLTKGANIFNVSDFASVETTLTVSGTLTNDAGSTTVSGSISINEEPEISSDFNSLTIYQVMVSSFQDGDSSRGYEYGYGPDGALRGGDLQGIINAAEYIKNLGCNAIWMTPIFDSSSGSQNTYLNSTGYFTYDYFNVDPKFGTNETFRTLVETYHSKGMYVILDGVFGHWGDNVKASPTGKTPKRSHGQYKACDYPVSLDFFKEVAQYWIKEYKIDGWRLDQCYQVGLGEHGNGDNDNSFTGGHNYWYEIRKSVEQAAAENGSGWGSLGYMVGEHWMGDASIIQKGSIDKGSAAGYGLRSCFDFPARYQLVQSMAIEESKNVKDVTFADAVAYAMGTSTDKGYYHDEGYYPNLFITNHDLVRFGNLITWACGDSPSQNASRYYNKHKVAMATLAAYTGPVTIYYGDEWGAYVAGYTGSGSLGAYNDNVARSTGKISGFNSNEQSVIDFTKQVLSARASHEALWNGTNTTVSANSTLYVGKKTCGSETIIYALNYGETEQTFAAKGQILVSESANSTSVTGTAKVAPYSATYVLQK